MENTDGITWHVALTEREMREVQFALGEHSKHVDRFAKWRYAKLARYFLNELCEMNAHPGT